MKFDLQNHSRKTLRKRLTEYRNYKLESGTEASIHINAIEIALALVEYAIEKIGQSKKKKKFGSRQVTKFT